VQKVLSDLTNLQQIDLQLDDIISLRGDLPHQVEKLNAKKQASIDEATNLQNQLDACQKERAEKELLVKELSEKKKKYQSQLFEVKNNREYDAISLEIEAVGLETSETETRILQLIDQEEQLKTAIEKHKTILEEIEKEFVQKSEDLKKLIAKTEKDEIYLKDQREKTVRHLNNRILSTYERIRKAKQGKAIVPIIRRTCGGCFKSLPPQRVLEVRKMNRIILCEVCGRILVWDENKSELDS
jgi:uncharacterized protein